MNSPVILGSNLTFIFTVCLKMTFYPSLLVLLICLTDTEHLSYVRCLELGALWDTKSKLIWSLSQVPS